MLKELAISIMRKLSVIADMIIVGFVAGTVLHEEWSATGFVLVIIGFSIASISFEALAIRRAKK